MGTKFRQEEGHFVPLDDRAVDLRAKKIAARPESDESRLPRFLPNGGEEEIRTLDPHVANVMLYQLSYFPIRGNAA